MSLDFASNPEVQALTTQTDQLVAHAQTFIVKNAEQYSSAGEELTRIKATQKRLETIRKGMTQPLDAAKKAIMDFFRGPEAKLSQAESGIKRAMIGYSDEQDRLRREEQRKADERARKERERLEAQAAAAAASGKAGRAEQLQERAATVVAPVIHREAPKVTGVNMRDVWKFAIEDEAQIPRAFLAVDESKIRKHVANMKGDTQIPGVRVYCEKQMAAGAA